MSGLTIAEVAERTGLTAHTLRYYERDGLMLGAVERSTTGRRVYSEGDVGWLVMLTRLRATGMPIREVKAYVDLARQGDATHERRLELLRAHRARVLAQLAQVTDHLGAIDKKIGYYEDSLARASARSA